MDDRIAQVIASSQPDEPQAVPQALAMPPVNPVTTVRDTRERRKRRKKVAGALVDQTGKQGTDIIIGRFVVFYILADPASNIKRNFSIGKVVKLVDDNTNQIAWLNNRSVHQYRGWKMYTGKGKKHQDIQKEHVIICRSGDDLWFQGKKKAGARGWTVRQTLKDKIQAGVEMIKSGREWESEEEEDEERCEEDAAAEELET